MNEKPVTESLRKYIPGHKPSDVTVGGYTLDGDPSREFLPDMTAVFMRFGDVYLACQSIEQFSKMRLSFCREIFYNKVDDDVQYGCLSLTHILESDFDLGDFFIKEIVLFDPVQKNGELACTAVCFELSNGDCFFLDPEFPWGIKPGGRKLYEKWLENRLSCFPEMPVVRQNISL